MWSLPLAVAVPASVCGFDVVLVPPKAPKAGSTSPSTSVKTPFAGSRTAAPSYRKSATSRGERWCMQAQEPGPRN